MRRLGDDSRRLGAHEVRLAKLELGETLATVTNGAIWAGVGVGIAVVSAVALTIFLSTLIGRLAGAHYWLGATSVGVIELLVGAWCVQRGLRLYRETDFSFARSREVLRESAAWAQDPRRAMALDVEHEPARRDAAARDGPGVPAPRGRAMRGD